MLAPLHQSAGLLTPKVATALARPGVTLAWLVDITWPGGAGRYSMRDFSSASRGLYKGVLRDAGVYEYGVSDRKFGIETQEPSIVVEDLDYEIADRIQEGGAYGAPVKVRLAVQDVSSTEWPVIFVGVLREWEEVEPLVWRLTFGYDDAELYSDFPRTVIPPEDFPQASEEARSMVAPLIYGLHKSDGVGFTGMISVRVIDRTQPDYMVSRAFLGVHNEFVDGAKVTPPTGSVEGPLRGGRLYTVVEGNEFLPAVSPPGTQVTVTVDPDGLLESPVTLSPRIENGADIILHIADNWIWAEYTKEQVWLSGTSPVHLGWIDSVRKFFRARGYKSGRFIATKQQAVNLIEEWCYCHQCPVFWTMNGRLAFRIADDSIHNVWNHPWVKYHEGELGPLSLRFEAVDLVRQIDGRYLYHEAAGSFQFALSIVDHNVPFPTAEAFDDPWSHHAVD